MMNIKYTLYTGLLSIILFFSGLSLSAQDVSISSSFQMDDKGRGNIFVTYSIPENLHQIDNRDFFNFTLESEAITLGEIIYPETTTYGNFEGYEGVVTLEAPFTYKGRSEEKKSLDTLELTARYQLCDDQGTCLRPDKTTASSMRAENSITDSSKSPTPGSGLGLFLLFAFLGGIILNIMPCVLPVLSIKALHLVEQSQDNRKKIFLNSISYAGGILFSMIILGTIIIAIKASGTLLGWGFQFQNPMFVLILTSLVLLFALSLFEIFFINPPQAAGKVAGKQKSHGYLGSFVTGIMAVLLATPCTAPLLGSALGFAFSQRGGIILIFFILIGLGLALPFILIGIYPGFIKKLPKPGEWMNRFREIMGFLLLGTVVYLLTILHGQMGTNFRGILWFLLIVTFGAWLFGRSQRTGGHIKPLLKILSLAVILSGALIFVDFTPQATGTATLHGEETIPFSPEQIEVIRAQNQPLFLEFSADWCATCRSNHLTVLDRDFRRDLFDEMNIVYMIGDYTLNDPVIAQWLQKFGRAGVPLYIYYPPGEEPVILPELLTRSILENAVIAEQKIKGN